MRYLLIIFLIFIIIIFSYVNLDAQETPVSVFSKEVYSFIDELANEKLFALNSCVKPYSQKDIAEMLLIADSLRTHLSVRQQNELDIYLYEFTGKNNRKPIKEKPQWKIFPPEFRYNNHKSSFILRPVYEFKYSLYKNGRPFYQSGGGAEIIFHKSIVSAYANLTDHYFNKEILIKPGYLISGLGGNYKVNEGGRDGGDFSEMRGGLILGWKWGHIGFVKDHVQWGDNNFGGLILSGQNPSFPMLTLHAKPFKWLTLDYLHGWLVSEVIDSSSSYYSKPGVYRGVYQPKYIAANMLSFEPWKCLNISIGNSIIYSDMPVQLVYLIPVLFYKSVDHTLNHGIDNQNSQIFMNVSCRNVKHLHLYGSLFMDEFSIRRIKDPIRNNFFGFKLGGTLSNWPLKDLALVMESTIIYPMVYKHRVATLTYTSNNYNLGYRMGDNSLDFHLKLRYMPIQYLFAEVHYEYAIHGNNYEYFLNNDLDRHPLIKNKVWERQILSARITYLPVVEIKIFLEGLYSKMVGFFADGLTPDEYLNMYSPKVFQGNNFYFNFGIQLGL
jgi:hypothetical protein